MPWGFPQLKPGVLLVPAMRNSDLWSSELTSIDARYADMTFASPMRILGVEAAHIKWHQAGGPDVVSNGLCLCVLHHRVFDRGAIGISTAGRLLVSEEVHGSRGLEEWLLRFEGKPLGKPQRTDYNPKPEFVAWHLHEVFRAPARELILHDPDPG